MTIDGSICASRLHYPHIKSKEGRRPMLKGGNPAITYTWMLGKIPQEMGAL